MEHSLDPCRIQGYLADLSRIQGYLADLSRIQGYLADLRRQTAGTPVQGYLAGLRRIVRLRRRAGGLNSCGGKPSDDLLPQVVPRPPRMDPPRTLGIGRR